MEDTIALAKTPPAEDAIDRALIADLRTDHAGETGAVYIYRGILAVSRDPALRDFATRHMATERDHLRRISDVLPPAQRSRLTPLWRVAGWLTGALPALWGPRAVYATIAAVETFVDEHYQEQIDRLAANGRRPDIRQLMIECQADEISHRDEAAAAAHNADGPIISTWTRLVGAGSKAAVSAARIV